jgi:hypothetical protein
MSPCLEAGSNASAVALWIVGDEKGTQCLGENLAAMSLGHINTEIGPPSWWSLESDTIKCGHDSHGIRTWEWLRRQGPATIEKDRPTLSSETMLHKDYDRKCLVDKNTGHESQRACCQSELIGGKPPVVK